MSYHIYKYATYRIDVLNTMRHTSIIKLFGETYVEDIETLGNYGEAVKMTKDKIDLLISEKNLLTK